MKTIENRSSQHHVEDYDVEQIPIDKLLKLEDGHFWYQLRNEWISFVLRQNGIDLNNTRGMKFLEVGCGAGMVAAHLVKLGFDYVGVDTSDVLIEKARERHSNLSFLCDSVENLPGKYAKSFDVIGFFDVLEHVQAPVDLLASSLCFAKPGAKVIATVPARQALYSTYDRLIGHKKRYELFELKNVLESAGLQSVHEYGAFRSLIPLQTLDRQVFLRRIEKRAGSNAAKEILEHSLRLPSPRLNRVMGFLVGLEVKWFAKSSEDRLGSSQLACGSVNGR